MMVTRGYVAMAAGDCVRIYTNGGGRAAFEAREPLR